MIFLAAVYILIGCADIPEQTNYFVRYSVQSYSHTVRVEYRNSRYGYTCREITGEWSNYAVLPANSMASLFMMVRLDAGEAFRIIENKDSLIYASIEYEKKRIERKRHVILMTLVIE